MVELKKEIRTSRLPQELQQSDDGEKKRKYREVFIGIPVSVLALFSLWFVGSYLWVVFCRIFQPFVALIFLFFIGNLLGAYLTYLLVKALTLTRKKRK